MKMSDTSKYRGYRHGNNKITANICGKRSPEWRCNMKM